MLDTYLGRWALVLVGIVLLFACYAAFYAGAALGQSYSYAEQGYRYLVLRQAFVFERGDELPYEAIRPMAYDDVLGYVDIPIVNAYRAYVVVDLDTGHYAEVMISDSGCFAMWMLPEIGADNHPHINTAEWIVCETS